MELREFVKTTVLELQGAILDIAKGSTVEYIFGTKSGGIDSRGGVLKFDVAVEATEKQTGKGGVSVRVPVIRTGGEIGKTKEREDSYTSRIQFELVTSKNAHSMHAEAREYHASQAPKSSIG
jgi:hypothetical protein